MKDVKLLMLKAVSVCNLQCSYCSAHCASKQPAILDKDLTCQVLKELLDVLHPQPRELDILWHGGEPTLFPADKAKNLMQKMRNIANDYNTTLVFKMQTNGYSISEEWIQLFLDEDIALGISIDGPDFIHDKARLDKNGSGSWNKVMANIEKLVNLGCKVSMLSVIDDRHTGHAKEYFEWLKSVHLPVRLNPYFDCSLRGQSVWKQYFLFLRQLMELALQNDYDISITPLDNMIKRILSAKYMIGECSYSGYCARNFLCFGADGMVSSCGRLSDNGGDKEIYKPGQLGELIKKFRSIIQNNIDERKLELHCMDCEIKSFCNGYCHAVKLDPESGFCDAIRNFYSFLSSEALSLIKQRVLREKAKVQAKIAAIQQLMAEEVK